MPAQPMKHKRPKRAPSRARNAAPRATSPARPRGGADSAQPSKADTVRHLWQSVVGSAGASALGALSVRWGFHPLAVMGGLGGLGSIVSVFGKNPGTRNAATGVASAASSQLILQQIAAPPAPVTVTATAIPTPTRIKNADLGQLPPGMLDAAFERARAELAVSGDGYPPGYDPHDFDPEHGRKRGNGHHSPPFVPE